MMKDLSILMKVQTILKKNNHLFEKLLDCVNYNVESAKYHLVVKYFIPYLAQYVRKVIIANGLDPDPLPKCDFKKEKPFLKDHYVPGWVKHSFKDVTKHPLFRRISTDKKDNRLFSEECIDEFLQKFMDTVKKNNVTDDCVFYVTDGYMSSVNDGYSSSKMSY